LDITERVSEHSEESIFLFLWHCCHREHSEEFISFPRVDLLKNISPTLWVIRLTHHPSTKISPLPGVPNLYKHNPSVESPLASGSFPWRRDGENAVDLCDGIAKIIEPLWGSTSRKMPFFSAVTLGNEVSRNNSIHNGIGEQVPNRRFRMTGNCGTLSYRFFTHRSESDMHRSELDIPERDSEHSERTIFFPRVDLLKNISPLSGVIR